MRLAVAAIVVILLSTMMSEMEGHRGPRNARGRGRGRGRGGRRGQHIPGCSSQPTTAEEVTTVFMWRRVQKASFKKARIYSIIVGGGGINSLVVFQLLPENYLS